MTKGITTKMCLIRGTAALKFEIDLNKDSDRIRILISMAIWAIWKSRNKSAISDQDGSPNETSETLKELIQAQIRKSWNATRFLEGKRKLTQQRIIQTLWADGKLKAQSSTSHKKVMRPARPAGGVLVGRSGGK